MISRNVRENTKSFFRVLWSDPVDEFISNYDETCNLLGCGRDTYDNLCLCPVDVEESAVFTTPPTRDQVLAELHMGAFSPNIHFDEHEVVELSDGVKMYSLDGSYSADCVFEVTDDNGQKQYRKNLASTTKIGSASAFQLKFRNPPHIISIHDPDIRDVLYETEAALDHYFVSTKNTLSYCVPSVSLTMRYLSSVPPKHSTVFGGSFCPAIWNFKSFPQIC